MLVTAEELDQPYSADEGADRAILAAESRVLSALRSSPRQWSIPDDLTAWATGTDDEKRLHAELISLIRAIAHGSLTSGRAGVSKVVTKRYDDAVARLKEISGGADLGGITRSATAASALSIVGTCTPRLANLLE